LPPLRWDWPAMAISALALLALVRYKADTIKLILVCAVAGLVLSYLR
jgi:chromate transporter